MSCLSILFSVYILSIHHQRGKPVRCPKSIKFVAFSIIAPALCLKIRSSGHVATKKANGQEKDQKEDNCFDEANEVINLMQMPDPEMLKDEYAKVVNPDNNLNDLDPILKHYKDKESSVNELILWLHNKQQSESIEDESFQEWRDVAFVLDRLLFVVFLITTVVSTALILSLIPDHSLTGFSEYYNDVQWSFY